MKGIDISNLNGTADIAGVKNAGYGFIISKITEGSTFLDKYGASNVANTQANGLIAGAYHFARFRDKNTAIREAEFFKQNCPSNVDFVVLDFEQQCSGDMTDACLAFLDSVSSIAPAIIYCNPNYINLYLNSNITKYPLWIAHYSVSSPSTPKWGNYAIWQYSEHGQVCGVSGDVDLNISGGDFDKLLVKSYKQGNEYCKNRTSPILPYAFVTTGHSEFKAGPDSNAPTNGVREAGFQLMAYGKDGGFFSVNKNGTQFFPISQLSGTKSCAIQKVIQVINCDGAKCYENPSNKALYNGTVPYKKYLPVYCTVDNCDLVNGVLANLQWTVHNSDVKDVYPNKFSQSINKDSLPILENFTPIEDTPIYEMPILSAKQIGVLKKDELIHIYGKFGDFYLISNTEKKFVYIPKFINTKPLSVIKQVKVTNADGAFCRENISNQDKNNGIVPCGKILNVYLEFDGYYLVNGSNINLQWVSNEDCSDI